MQKLVESKILAVVLASAWLLLMMLSACSDNKPTTTGSLPSSGPAKTAAPPFPAIAPSQTYVSVPTPTEFQPIPALLPTSTPLPLPYTDVSGANGQPASPTITATKTTPASRSTKTPAKSSTPVVVTSPNNGLLAYIQGGDLWTVNTDGTNRRQISTGGNLSSAKIIWSPNRDRLAFIGPTGNLETFDLSGKHADLFTINSNAAVLDPVWSPSGRYIAFTIHNNETTAIAGGEIWLVDAIAANFKPRKVVDGFAPAWSPDSASLAYTTRSQLTDVNALPTTPATKATTPAATTAPVVPNLVPYNQVAIYELASNASHVLIGSVNLPPYLGLDNQAHTIEPTTLRQVWWSPNGKSVAFSDRQSFIGIINTSGNQLPVIWTGQPDAFAVSQLYWINNAQEPLLIWSSSATDDNSQMGVVVGPGKLTKLAGGLRADCPALIPGGSLVAYADNKSTLVVRPDGSIYGLYSGGSCPTWSPDGKALATVKRDSDGSIVLLTPNAAKAIILQTVKGVDSVYWLKAGGEVLIQGGAGVNGP